MNLFLNYLFVCVSLRFWSKEVDGTIFVEVIILVKFVILSIIIFAEVINIIGLLLLELIVLLAVGLVEVVVLTVWIVDVKFCIFSVKFDNIDDLAILVVLIAAVLITESVDSLHSIIKINKN